MSQLALFDLPPAAPLWRLPDARKDRASRLAVLLRNILWQHEQGGCRASNEFFAHDSAMGLRCDVATVRRGLADLEACGLIERVFDALGQRTIVPKVSVEDLLEAGWEALARAIVGMKQWGAEVRQLCRQLLQRLGKWSAPRSLRSPDGASESKNCAAIARTIARPLPYKERKAQKTTTQNATPQAPEQAQSAPVAVSASSKPEPLHEALPETAALAVQAGLDTRSALSVVAGKSVSSVRQAIQAAKQYAQRKTVTNFPGLVRQAITAGWLPQAPSQATERPADPSARPASDFRVKVQPLPGWTNVKSSKSEASAPRQDCPEREAARKQIEALRQGKRA